jgi:hypothetical protein
MGIFDPLASSQMSHPPAARLAPSQIYVVLLAMTLSV